MVTFEGNWFKYYADRELEELDKHNEKYEEEKEDEEEVTEE